MVKPSAVTPVMRFVLWRPPGRVCALGIGERWGGGRARVANACAHYAVHARMRWLNDERFFSNLACSCNYWLWNICMLHKYALINMDYSWYRNWCICVLDNLQSDCIRLCRHILFLDTVSRRHAHVHFAPKNAIYVDIACLAVAHKTYAQVELLAFRVCAKT